MDRILGFLIGLLAIFGALLGLLVTLVLWGAVGLMGYVVLHFLQTGRIPGF